MVGPGVETRNKKLASGKPSTPTTASNALSSSGSGVLSAAAVAAHSDSRENSDLISLISGLDSKLDSLRSDFQRQLKELHQQIICDVHRNLTAALEDKVDSKLSELHSTVTVLSDRIDALERHRTATDVILNGIPRSTNEDLHAIYEKLCSSIKITAPPINNIFRVRSKSSANEDTSIIIKCCSPHDKNVILKGASVRYKSSGGPLTLRDMGLDSSSRIFIHESLSKYNYIIYRKALRLKRLKQLESAFTVGGRVYVRKRHGDSAVLISNITQFDGFIVPSDN